MKFGIMFANAGPFADPGPAVALARAAEDAGFESLWTVEHVVVPKGYRSPYPYSPSGRMPGDREDFDIPDPLIWLSYVAGATTTIKLGTGILIVPQRNPVVTAKAVATLDHMSGGRMLLGVGSGWLAEEFAALGESFEDRGPRTDDYLRAYRSLWRDEVATHHGPFVSFRDVYCRPRPVNGDVPIIVGGHSKRAARRAGELGDGFFPARGTVDELRALFDRAKMSAEKAGRDPDALELTAGWDGRPELLEQLIELGVSRVVVPPTGAEQMAEFGETTITAYS